MYFSIGDYKIHSDFAAVEQGYGGQRFYFPKAKAATAQATMPTGAATTATQVVSKPAPYTVVTPKPTAPVTVISQPTKPTQARSRQGVRKSHTRNVGGKTVMVGQSVLKAGKKTAGTLAAISKMPILSAKANLGILGASAAAVGVGSYFLVSRKSQNN